MKVTYYVNAMILLEGTENRILCDPWITFNGESRSGLFNFPPTKFTREDVQAIEPNLIYISHTHADHFDPETLSLFERDTEFLVADFKNNFTERNLRRLGFQNIRIVDSTRGIEIGVRDRVWIQPSLTYPEVDSLAAFRIDECTIFNANDNPFHELQTSQFKELLGDVDLCCVPFAFQGPYPAFYENLSVEQKIAEATKKKSLGYSHVRNYARVLKPKRLFAFAAGALYGGDKALLNRYYGVGSAKEAIDSALNEVKFTPVFLSAGVSVSLPDGTIDGDYIERDHTSEQAYIDAVASNSGPFDQGGQFWIDPSERIDLSHLLSVARVRQDEWAHRTGRWSEMVFFIDVGEPELYRMKLGEPGVRRLKEDEIKDECFEIFRVPYPLMIGLLTKHYNWSNVKTQFVSFYRKPDTFDRDLHILMSYLQI